MRASVAASEALIYTPAILACTRHLGHIAGSSPRDTAVAVAAILLHPATTLIDHGHFQYNTVMLGLAAAALAAVLARRPAWACVAFVAALGFKQMALFYAPALAAYLAGSCIVPHARPRRFAALAAATLTSLALLYAPLLLGAAWDAHRGIALPASAQPPPLLRALTSSPHPHPALLQLTQSLHRTFPLARGLFEDKVANLWCALHASGLHKLHRYPPATLARAALALTSLAIAPPCAIIFLRPRRALLPLACAACAWAFFLCSYQVHEKSILLPLLPTTLLLAGGAGRGSFTADSSLRAWVGFANLLAAWTLFPLLARDGLRVPYAVGSLLWAYLLGLPPCGWALYGRAGGLGRATRAMHLVSYAGMLAWHVGEAWVAPPKGLPDFWPVLNVCGGAVGGVACWGWCLGRLVRVSGLGGGGGGGGGARQHPPASVKARRSG